MSRGSRDSVDRLNLQQGQSPYTTNINTNALAVEKDPRLRLAIAAQQGSNGRRRRPTVPTDTTVVAAASVPVPAPSPGHLVRFEKLRLKFGQPRERMDEDRNVVDFNDNMNATGPPSSDVDTAATTTPPCGQQQLVQAQPVSDDELIRRRERIERLEQERIQLERIEQEERRSSLAADVIAVAVAQDAQSLQPSSGVKPTTEGGGKGTNQDRRKFLALSACLCILVLTAIVATVTAHAVRPERVNAAEPPTAAPAVTQKPTTFQPTLTPTAAPSSRPTYSLAPTTIVYRTFQTKQELVDAVDAYVQNRTNTSSVAQMYGFPIGNWDVSQITDFSDLFSMSRNPAMISFQDDLSTWDVSRSASFIRMFYKANKFTSDLSGWDTSQAVYMNSMFAFATTFTSNLSLWKTGTVGAMDSMFQSAESFNSDLSTWDVSNVQYLSNIFNGATSFNSNLSQWNVASAGSFESAFTGATSFTSNLCSWGTQLSPSVLVMNMFEGSACPNTTDPDLSTKTPFCFNCFS